MTDVKNQMRGRRSKTAGDTFEKWISDACQYYDNLDIAIIEKTPEPMKPIRPYGERYRQQYIAYFVKSAQPDYKGMLCDGTSIMFEAKHTDNERIKQNRVTDTQWENLDKYEKYGAHCYILVSLGLVNFYRVPWNIWKEMKSLFGHKYMTNQELEPYRIEFNHHLLFLEGVELQDEDYEKRAVTGD